MADTDTIQTSAPAGAGPAGPASGGSAGGDPKTEKIVIGQKFSAGGKSDNKIDFIRIDGGPRLTSDSAEGEWKIKDGSRIEVFGKGLGIYNSAALWIRGGGRELVDSVKHKDRGAGLEFTAKFKKDFYSDGSSVELEFLQNNRPDNDRSLERKFFYSSTPQADKESANKAGQGQSGTENSQSGGSSAFDPTQIVMQATKTALGGVAAPFLPNSVLARQNRGNLEQALKSGDKAAIKKTIGEATRLGDTEGLKQALKFTSQAEHVSSINEAIKKTSSSKASTSAQVSQSASLSGAGSAGEEYDLGNEQETFTQTADSPSGPDAAEVQTEQPIGGQVPSGGQTTVTQGGAISPGQSVQVSASGSTQAPVAASGGIEAGASLSGGGPSEVEGEIRQSVSGQPPASRQAVTGSGAVSSGAQARSQVQAGTGSRAASEAGLSQTGSLESTANANAASASEATSGQGRQSMPAGQIPQGASNEGQAKAGGPPQASAAGQAPEQKPEQGQTAAGRPSSQKETPEKASSSASGESGLGEEKPKTEAPAQPPAGLGQMKTLELSLKKQLGRKNAPGAAAAEAAETSGDEEGGGAKGVVGEDEDEAGPEADEKKQPDKSPSEKQAKPALPVIPPKKKSDIAQPFSKTGVSSQVPPIVAEGGQSGRKPGGQAAGRPLDSANQGLGPELNKPLQMPEMPEGEGQAPAKGTGEEAGGPAAEEGAGQGAEEAADALPAEETAAGAPSGEEVSPAVKAANSVLDSKLEQEAVGEATSKLWWYGFSSSAAFFFTGLDFFLGALSMDAYWVFGHRKNPKMFPMKGWQKVVTVLANVLPFILIAFLISLVMAVGCNWPKLGGGGKALNYRLSAVGLVVGDSCAPFDLTAHGGGSSGATSASAPTTQ